MFNKLLNEYVIYIHFYTYRLSDRKVTQLKS